MFSENFDNSGYCARTERSCEEDEESITNLENSNSQPVPESESIQPTSGCSGAQPKAVFEPGSIQQ